jgi:shikimate 5-dehydrogenase
MKQLAVLGSPIGHALCPVLHRAAYRNSAWTGPIAASL